MIDWLELKGDSDVRRKKIDLASSMDGRLPLDSLQHRPNTLLPWVDESEIVSGFSMVENIEDSEYCFVESVDTMSTSLLQEAPKLSAPIQLGAALNDSAVETSDAAAAELGAPLPRARASRRQRDGRQRRAGITRWHC